MRPARAGRYRQRITIYAPAVTETLDTYGQPNGTPVTVGTFSARVIPLTGHELVAARQLVAQAEFDVEMRWQGSSVVISPLNWFTMNGREFGIFNVRNVEERDRRYRFGAFERQMGNAV